MSFPRPYLLLAPFLFVPFLLSFFPQNAAAEELPPPEGWELRGDAAAGREDFVKKCAVCHGESGDGHGRLKIDPPPRDLRDAEYMDTRSDWQIYLAIRDGGPAVGMSRQMIAWSSLLNEQEMHNATAYVRSLSTEDSADEPGADEPGEDEP